MPGGLLLCLELLAVGIQLDWSGSGLTGLSCQCLFLSWVFYLWLLVFFLLNIVNSSEEIPQRRGPKNRISRSGINVAFICCAIGAFGGIYGLLVIEPKTERVFAIGY